MRHRGHHCGGGNDKSEVNVTYVQGAELKTVAAKAVIMATPKFITRRLVAGLAR